MPETQVGREALRRAIRVRRALDGFLDACDYWLEVRDHPAGIMTHYSLFLLTPFEGVPEVYPFAEELLDSIGPGHRHDIEWFPPGRAPGLRHTVGVIAYHVRDLIVETWGWRSGLDLTRIREAVKTRSRSGCPTVQRLGAQVLEAIESLPPEIQWQCHVEPGRFDEMIPPEKSEQFERIVQYQLDQLPERLLRFTTSAPEEWVRILTDRYEASPLGQVERLVHSPSRVREMTYMHIDDLDAFERKLHSKDDPPETEADRIQKNAEIDRHRNEPIIGRQAARIDYGTMKTLWHLLDELEWAIDARRRPPDPRSEISPQESNPVDQTPPAQPAAQLVSTETARPLLLAEPSAPIRPAPPISSAKPASEPLTPHPPDTVDAPIDQDETEPADTVVGVVELLELMKAEHTSWALPIAFLDYMKNRTSSEYLDLADAVWGDRDKEEGTIRQLVKRVNTYAQSKKATCHFECGGGRVARQSEWR